MKKYLLCLFFFAVATMASADMRQSEEGILLSAPKAPWELRIPQGAWQLQEERRSEDNLAYYWMLSDPQTMATVSFFIEPAEKCKTSAECRDQFVSNPGPLYESPQSLVKFEENGFAAVKFIVPAVRGVPLNQINYSAHLVRDGYWVDMHLSKALFKEQDEPFLSEFIKTISVQEKPPVDAEQRAEQRHYPLADQGFLRIRVPLEWKEESQQATGVIPPTIVFKPTQGDPFEILITPGLLKKDVAQPKPEAVREQVQATLDRLRPEIAEKDAKVSEIKGESAQGYYFSVTDKSPKPGEYKFLSQGILTVGEVTVTFTILTNDNQEKITKAALDMLKSASQMK